MVRYQVTAAVLALSCAAAFPASAADTIDSLAGKFTFNWFTEPANTKCAAVSADLVAQFKSDAFTCDLNVVTNTASGEGARTCSKKDGEVEYLVFDSEKACEEERKAQESNSE